MRRTEPSYRVNVTDSIPYPVVIRAKKYKINRARVVTDALIAAIDEYEQEHGISDNGEPIS